MTTSRWLSAGQLRGLRKVGDIVMPGNDEFPSFSQSGAIAHVDRMLDYVKDSDRDGLRLVFGLFRVLPGPAVRSILALSERHRWLPGPLGAAARQINLGVKGVVFTLYYSDVGSGRSIHELIGYDAKVIAPAVPSGEV
ncbi:hypothetical protein L6Q96_01080 [Candidatus Binatia bacterium]|nr:hypothetical protein [Candidatus Binatia bacterium]